MTNQRSEGRETAEYYAEAARRIRANPDTPITDETTGLLATHYDTEALDDLPANASLGCGNPLAVADLHPGETVLDLGSGAGLDVLLSARRVGPTGRAIGLDMTPDMLTIARDNATSAGIDNAEFRHGHIENIPLPEDSVDVVISNCVITLAADKHRVFTEIARVLRPGGRIGISDIVAENTLTDTERAHRSDQCRHSLTTDTYTALLATTGFTDITITTTHPAGDKLHAATLRARTPTERR